MLLQEVLSADFYVGWVSRPGAKLIVVLRFYSSEISIIEKRYFFMPHYLLTLKEKNVVEFFKFAPGVNIWNRGR